MKSKFIVATVVTLAALTSAGAFAQSSQNHLYGEAALVVPPVASGSSVARGQVANDYANARQNGEAAAYHESAIVRSNAPSGAVSRQAVRSEAAVWARSHQTEGQSAG